MASSSTHTLENSILSLCRKNPQGLPEEELQRELGDMPLNEKAAAINALLKQHKLQIFKGQNDMLVYKEIVEQDVGKFKGLGSEEMLVYQLIQQNGNVGMWTKDMKFKSNLQQPQVTKILKTLESRKLIKAVKSVTGGNRKVYMLYELEPSRELTGGAWYTEHEFDSEFIGALREACFRYIEKQGETTLAEISTFIQTRGFSKVDLRNEDVLSIVNTLIYDGRVDSVEYDDDGDIEHFRLAMVAVPKSSAFTSTPCGVCPVLSQCTPDGLISPANCVYYDKWLDF